tara:strand:+ start:669 stop:1232 length:564 start_codon:yes stop_codon:yes gene_type:complete
MNSGKGKYYTIEVTPTCHTSEVDDNDNLFLWTEIPNAIPRGHGSTSLLRKITMMDADDNAVDVELFFAQTKDAAASVTGALGAATTLTNMTDAEISTLKPLFRHVVDTDQMSRWDATDNIMYVNTGDHVASAAAIANRMGYACYSFATAEQIGAGNANPGSIYFMGVATATKTYTASGLKFIFTFES